MNYSSTQNNNDHEFKLDYNPLEANTHPFDALFPQEFFRQVSRIDSDMLEQKDSMFAESMSLQEVPQTQLSTSFQFQANQNKDSVLQYDFRAPLSSPQLQQFQGSPFFDTKSIRNEYQECGSEVQNRNKDLLQNQQLEKPSLRFVIDKSGTIITDPILEEQSNFHQFFGEQLALGELQESEHSNSSDTSSELLSKNSSPSSDEQIMKTKSKPESSPMKKQMKRISKKAQPEGNEEMKLQVMNGKILSRKQLRGDVIIKSILRRMRKEFQQEFYEQTRFKKVFKKNPQTFQLQPLLREYAKSGFSQAEIDSYNFRCLKEGSAPITQDSLSFTLGSIFLKNRMQKELPVSQHANIEEIHSTFYAFSPYKMENLRRNAPLHFILRQFLEKKASECLLKVPQMRQFSDDYQSGIEFLKEHYYD